MQFMVVDGSNNKKYIQIWNYEPNELQYKDIIKNIVSRTEYKPFLQSFNKTISQSYFVNETFVPVQFWPDIKIQLDQILPTPVVLINEQALYYDLDREIFEEYIFGLELPPKYDITLERYAYQPEAVYLAITNQIARIEVGTGGGKTLLTYLYCRWFFDNYLEKDRKILIIVPRKDLVKQSRDDFKEYDSLQTNKLVIESIYSGAVQFFGSNVVVGTYQSLCEYDESYFDEFDVIVCDEVHTGKAYSIKTGIYDKCRNAKFFFGMTGTNPEYQTLDYLNIVSMFGPLVLLKRTYELIDDGVVVPVVIHAIQINYKEEKYKNYSKGLKEEGIIGTEKYRIEKYFFQHHEPRTKLLAKLINNFEYNHLILVDTVQYCKDLADYLQIHCPNRYIRIIHGNVKNRDEIKLEMKTRLDMVLIATYETMSTGVSIPSIMHIHFPDGGKSPIRIKQSCGRGLRLHPLKDYCNVFDYQDNIQNSSFKNHSRARLNIYALERFEIKFSSVTI